MRSRFAVLLSVVALVLGFSAAAVAAPGNGNDNGSTKTDILDNPSGACNVGATGGIDVGDVIINFPSDDTVSATVQLKKGVPNATYTVAIVQIPSGEECGGGTHTLTTDAAGKGVLHLSEAQIPGQTGAWVSLNGPDFHASRAASDHHG